MKKVVSLLLALSVIVGMISIPTMAKEAQIMAEIYVSVTGSENGDGTKNNPFKSIDEARIAVRKINKNMTGDIIVYVEDGVYELDETVHFTTEDSGRNGYKVRYVAANGAKPVISGGRQVTGEWQNEGNGIYSVYLDRNEKLRSLYVNGKRAYMTEGTADGKGSYGAYSITKGQADWAWVSGNMAKGVKFNMGQIPFNTRNQDDIEIMTQTTWNTAIVCVDHFEHIGNNQMAAIFQMPYGAVAQTPGWGNAYQFNQSGQRIYNVFEWLNEPGRFYFDKSAKRLYYYPREGENMDSAEVVVPYLETLIELNGEDKENRIKNIEFEGLTFAYTDWLLYKVGSSYGRATIQGAAGLISFSETNWHLSIYRAYDIGPGAVEVNNAEGVNFYLNTITHTGNDGLSLVNDVVNCTVDGNVFRDTAGSGVLIGHPQHTFIGDKNGTYGSMSDKEKYDVNVEGGCKNITFTNNMTYETARHFWGDAAIMAFHVSDLVMRNNHIEETPYNGLSLGWGWWNMNGDSDAIVPGVPTTTTRNNLIENNTFVRCMQRLGDAGAIYTISDMEGTVIRENYITNTGNPLLNQHIVRGIHPDEGTRHIYAENNLIEKMAKKDMTVIDIVFWGRKGDNTWLNTYTDNDRFMSYLDRETEPGTVCTRVVRETGIWGDDVFDFVSRCGIKSEYLSYMPKDAYRIQDRLLGPSFFKKADTAIDLGVNDADVDGEVWLAPEGTEVFVEGDNMTRATDGVIYSPKKDGEYRLFVVNGEEVSTPSSGRVIVFSGNLTAIEDGGKYRVSNEAPLNFEFRGEYIDKIYLNGEEINKDFSLTQEGTYTIEIEDLSNEITTVNFETYVEEVDRVFDTSLNVTGVSIIIGETDKTAWLVPCDIEITNAADLVEGISMTKSTGEIISAPEEKGEYRLVITDGVTVSKMSDAVLKVTDGADEIPAGLIFRLNAEDIEGKDGDKVSSWKEADGKFSVIQNTSAYMPKLKISESGMKYLEFDGVDDFLQLESGKAFNMNQKTNLSMVIMAAYKGEDPSTGSNGDTSAAFYFGDTGGWGSLLIAPHKSFVVTRFGSGQTSCAVKYFRDEANDGFNTIYAVKDGTNEKIYENGKLVKEVNDRYAQTANIQQTFAVGKTAADYKTTYFKGEIAEILIFDKTLSEDDVKNIQRCMNIKASMGIVKDEIVNGEIILNKGQGTYSIASWNRFKAAHKDMLILQSAILDGENINVESIAKLCAYYRDTIAYLDNNALVCEKDAESLLVPEKTKENIILPVKGMLGSDIIWESSMKGVISEEGVVTQPGEGEADALVKLTATVTYEGESVKREFIVKVPAFISEENIWHSTADYSTRNFEKITKGAISFDITANELTDGVVGICGSNVTPTDWGNYSVVVRLRPEGYFDARNGGAFEYTNKVDYVIGETYHVRIVADVQNKTYTVYITDEDNTTYTLAENFKFRTSAPTVGDLSKVSVRGGSGISEKTFAVTKLKAESGTTGELFNAVFDGKAVKLICTADEDFSGQMTVIRNGENFIEAVRSEVVLKKGKSTLFETECKSGNYAFTVLAADTITPLVLVKKISID